MDVRGAYLDLKDSSLPVSRRPLGVSRLTSLEQSRVKIGVSAAERYGLQDLRKRTTRASIRSRPWGTEISPVYFLFFVFLGERQRDRHIAKAVHPSARTLAFNYHTWRSFVQGTSGR